MVEGPPDGTSDRFETYEAALEEHSPEPLEEEPLGAGEDDEAHEEE